jgi:hypothetical protein
MKKELIQNDLEVVLHKISIPLLAFPMYGPVWEDNKGKLTIGDSHE